MSPSPALSGRLDLNQRPFGPQPNALPDCATPRGWVDLSFPRAVWRVRRYSAQHRCSSVVMSMTRMSLVLALATLCLASPAAASAAPVRECDNYGYPDGYRGDTPIFTDEETVGARVYDIRTKVARCRTARRMVRRFWNGRWGDCSPGCRRGSFRCRNRCLSPARLRAPPASQRDTPSAPGRAGRACVCMSSTTSPPRRPRPGRAPMRTHAAHKTPNAPQRCGVSHVAHHTAPPLSGPLGDRHPHCESII